MTSSVLIDTSYLISLSDDRRPNHQTAVRYFRHLIESQIPIYFSAIVAAEFEIKQPIVTLPLKKFRMLSFNIRHGIEAGRIANHVGQRDEGTPRHVARDDVKLIAQASYEKIPFILTEDTSTLTKYCDRLAASDVCKVRAVALASGFDATALSSDRQSTFGFEVSDLGAQ